MTLYSLRSPATITKWDSLGNPEATYEVSPSACTCPAGHRHTCRHRQMLPNLLPIIDSVFFWHYELGHITDFSGVPQAAEGVRIYNGQGRTEPEPPIPTPATPSQPSWRRI